MCGGGGGTVWGNGTTDGVEKGVIHTQNIRRKGGGIVLGGKGQRQVQLTLLKPSYQNNYWLFAGQGLVKIRSVFQKQAHKKTQIIKNFIYRNFNFFATDSLSDTIVLNHGNCPVTVHLIYIMEYGSLPLKKCLTP